VLTHPQVCQILRFRSNHSDSIHTSLSPRFRWIR